MHIRKAIEVRSRVVEKEEGINRSEKGERRRNKGKREKMGEGRGERVLKVQHR